MRRKRFEAPVGGTGASGSGHHRLRGGVGGPVVIPAKHRSEKRVPGIDAIEQIILSNVVPHERRSIWPPHHAPSSPFGQSNNGLPALSTVIPVAPVAELSVHDVFRAIAS